MATIVNINGINELDLNIPGSTSVAVVNGVVQITNQLTGDVTSGTGGPPNTTKVEAIQNVLIDTTTPLDTQILRYNSSTLKWTPSYEGRYPYVAVSTTYTILATDYQIECTTGTFNVTLPTAVGIAGQTYSIKNTGTGTITIDTTSSQTIDGNLTQTIAQWENIVVMSNGTGWIII